MNDQKTDEQHTEAAVLPHHYARFDIEPIRMGVENHGAGSLITKVQKYTMRYDDKNGLEDLAKARRCLDMLGEFCAGNKDWWKANQNTILCSDPTPLSASIVIPPIRMGVVNYGGGVLVFKIIEHAINFLIQKPRPFHSIDFTELLEAKRHLAMLTAYAKDGGKAQWWKATA